MNTPFLLRRAAPSIVAAAGLFTVGLLNLCHAPLALAAAAAQVVGERSSCSDVDPVTGLPLSTRVISPSMIRICDTAEVSVTINVNCEVTPLHVMISFDRSGSLVGQPMRDAKGASDALLDVLIAENNSSIKAGAISHGDPPRIDQLLTDRLALVKATIRGLEAGGRDNLPQSILIARQQLVSARSGSRIEPVDVMVVLSDGGKNYRPADAVRAAIQAKAQRILVVAICIDNRTPSGCDAMKQVASSGHYYVEAQDGSGLKTLISKIAQDVIRSAASFRSLVVEETLPPGLEYVDMSAVPVANYDAASRTLRWDLDTAPTGGQGLGYRVKPSDLDTYTVSAGTKAEYRDSQGAIGSIVVPTAVLSVPFRCDQPVATQVLPPTATPTPANTPVVPVPTLTHRPTSRLLYLPILNQPPLRGGLSSGRRGVIVTSSSGLIIVID